ncbi:MAG: hypothetical protein VZQ55_05910 [Ruminococcus sp.]|nr:hypothetical protein [Ruminococcus sp.]
MKRLISLFLIALVTISTLNVMTAGAVEVPKVSIDGNTSVTKTYGDKAFNLGLTVNADDAEVLKPKLTYTSANEKIAKVSDGGKVTLTGCGKTTITAKASMLNPYSFFAGEKYITAQKKVILTVTPGKVSFSIKKGDKKSKGYVYKKFIIKEQKNCNYIARVGYDSNGKYKFLSNRENKKGTNYIEIGFPKGYKFYVQIKAYVTIDGKKIASKFTSKKAIKL